MSVMKGDWVSGFLRFYDAQDRMLVAAGWPATSQWWRAQIERFLRSGRRRFVLRVGRRGGKSSTLCRFAVAWALYGKQYEIPPGDIGVVAFVSVSRDESGQRLRTIDAILRVVIGEKAYKRQGDTIELTDRPVAFRTFTASIAGVSGFTAILFVADEVSKWRDADTGANPASEVLASAGPTMATMPAARMFLCSSPLGTLDAHATAFDQGDTATQLVAHAPTWLANPTLSEEDTRALEADERLWRREYAAIPQATFSSAFDPQAVARAIGRVIQIQSSYQPVGIVDLSSGRGDACAYGVASMCLPSVDEREISRYTPGPWVPLMISTVINGKAVRFPSPTEGHRDVARDAAGLPIETLEYQRAQRPKLVFHTIDAIEGRFSGSISGSDLVTRIARVFHRHGVTDVIGDQREEFFARSEFQRNKLQFHSIAWTSSNKSEAVTRLNRLFAEDAIVLPSRPKLERELLSYSERIAPSGTLTYSARGGGHDDEASLLITCALAELERMLPGSTLHAPNYRTVVSGR